MRESLLFVVAALALCGCGGSRQDEVYTGSGGGGGGPWMPPEPSDAATTDAASADAGTADGSAERPDDAAPRITGNNSAVLPGPTVGTGTAPDSNLRRLVSVLPTTDDVLQVGSGYIVRASATATETQAIVPIINRDSGLRCRFAAAQLVWRDGLGTTLNQQTAVVLGSVGQDGSTFDASCLRPNETGFVVARAEVANLFAAVETLELTVGSDGLTTWTAPATSMRLTSYELALGGTDTQMVVHFTNAGTAGADLAGKAHAYVLLDGFEAPLLWGALDQALTPSTVLAPNESGSVRGTVAFAGTCRCVRPHLAFSVP